MAQASFSIEVRAATETLWELLVDRTRNPKRYVPGVETVEILDEVGPLIVRRITAGPMEVVEEITTDAERLRIDSTFVKHPKYRGTTSKRVTRPVPPQEFPTLTYVLDWQPTDPEGDDEDVMPFAMKGVRRTKELAEARHAAG